MHCCDKPPFLPYCCSVGKRDVTTVCQSGTDSCVQNALLMVNLILGIGFDKLVEDGQFAVNCELQERIDIGACFQDNAACFESYRIDNDDFVETLDFMCENKEEFIAGSLCWTSGAVGNAVIQCMSNTNSYCSAPACIRDGIAIIPGCTVSDASRFAEFTRLFLKSKGQLC